MPARKYPAKEDIIEGIVAAGSIAAYAPTIGKTATALSNYLGNQGFRGEVHKALEKAQPPIDKRPITDPERLKEDHDRAQRSHLVNENKKLRAALADRAAEFERWVAQVGEPRDPITYKVAKQNTKLPARSVITPIYDQQFGQFVRPSDTPGGRGNFNSGIFDKRLQRWVEGVTGQIRDYSTAHRIEELIIPMGGDHVEGDEIFAGQAWQLEFDPCEQVWQLGGKMEAAIRTVVRFAKEEIGIPWVAMYGVDDNHGKVGGRKSGARPKTYSWNHLFLRTLAKNLSADPIDESVIDPGGSIFFYCAGHEFQAIHGHTIRGWGGLPFYGLSRFDGRSIRLHNRIYRYLLAGHHHQPAEIPNGAGETLMSGDWVGANNLSGDMTAGSRPMQKVIYVADKWGVTETARIWFQDADEAYAPTEIHGQKVAA